MEEAKQEEPTEAAQRGIDLVLSTKVEDLSVELTLAHPISLNGVPGSGKVLTFRRATGAEQIWVDSKDGEMGPKEQLELISKLTGVAPADVEHISFFDLATIQEVIAGFCFLS